MSGFLPNYFTTHEGVEAPFYFSALQLRLCQIEYKFENSVPTESRIARRDPGMKKMILQKLFPLAVRGPNKKKL